MYQAPRSLVVVWSDIVKDRLFIFGLIIKIILITTLTPDVQSSWFIPFVVNAIENFGSSPWESFLNSKGDGVAFPYGPVMLLVQIPITFLGWLVDGFYELEYFAGLGFRLTLLSADILLLCLLLQQFEKYSNSLLIHYWLSPIVIFITYWHGQIDLIPVVLFMFSMVLLKSNQIMLSAFLLAAAVAAKHNVLIIFPFVVIYLWFKHNDIKEVSKFLTVFGLSIVLLEGIWLFDVGFHKMVLGSREIDKIFWLFIPIGEQLKVYILPLIYSLMVYYVWRLRRMNYELLLSSLSVAFGIILLLTPASVGWFLWIMPLLAIHYSKKSVGSVILGTVFSITFVIYYFIYSSGSGSILINNFFSIKENLDIINNLHFKSSLYTLLISVFSILILQIFRNGIKDNDYYHLGKKPLIIGISGASEALRNSLSSSLLSLFGANKTIEFPDRNNRNSSNESRTWSAGIYLPADSNKSLSIVKNIKSLLKNEPLNNSEFTFNKGLSRIQVILVNAYYALHYKQLLKMYDIAFFVNSKSNKEDNYLEEESSIYINEQKHISNAVYEISEASIENNNYANICVITKNDIYLQKLMRILVGICGLQVSVDNDDSSENIRFVIQGEVQYEDIRFALNMATPHLSEFTDQENGIKGGSIGIMQLITLIEIDEILNKRK